MACQGILVEGHLISGREDVSKIIITISSILIFAKTRLVTESVRRQRTQALSLLILTGMFVPVFAGVEIFQRSVSDDDAE
jgi:hypothetical protein